ncbi:MAG: GNAT family N-acetyltransferase [Thermomicrobia bacterium]|nr:GNAT family N-acetyltransferase [Thermomicrobia bacterium]
MGIERPFLIAMPDEWIGPRIIMRRYTEDDARPLFAAVMESQAHLRQWLAWADTYHSLDDAIEFVRRQTGHWAAVRSLAVPSFEIGYWLRQSAEGHGYMSEAVRLATTFLFDRLSAQRVFIRCDARNARSKAVAERLGFTFEGCHRRDEIGTGGIIRDTLVYALIPDEFAQVRKSWER